MSPKNYSKIKEIESNFTDPFIIMQINLENWDKIENKLLLYKNIPLGALDKQPYWKINTLVDDWLDDIDKQKKAKEAQERQMEANQSSKKNNFKNPKIPKAPKFK